VAHTNPENLMQPKTTLLSSKILPAPEIALPAGTVLLNGQYRIERFLSSGGFGITYFARDSLDRPVVIKECYPEAICARDNQSVVPRTQAYRGEFGSLIAMFIREARNLAQLRHPHIVGVHQVFEHHGTAYMALDLVDGQDLLSVLATEQATLSPGKVKKILLKLLDALSVVHDQDMLHRDISPDNILVDVWGNPVLIDFGAAREQASKKSRAVSHLMVVKDGYSPQEFYISGSPQGAFSDIYSLGASFYHLIAGVAPVDSQTRLAALASKHPDPCIPLVHSVSGYDPSFLAAIDKAMCVFPADRIQSAREWVQLIDTQERRAAAQSDQLSQGDLRKVIAEMVVEVEESIAHSLAEQKARAAIPPPPKEERVLEYLSPPEPEDEPEIPVAVTPKPTVVARILAAYCGRFSSRPLAYATVLLAVLYYVSENPDLYLSAAAAPQSQTVFMVGRALMSEAAAIFLTTPRA